MKPLALSMWRIVGSCISSLLSLGIGKLSDLDFEVVRLCVLFVEAGSVPWKATVIVSHRLSVGSTFAWRTLFLCAMCCWRTGACWKAGGCGDVGRFAIARRGGC